MSERVSASFLLVQARSSLGAIRLVDAVEILRPLPTAQVASGPPFLLGLSVIRGAPVPVVDLGALLGLTEPRDSKRYATVRAGARRVALAVEGVLGIRTLEGATFEALPPLYGAASGEAIQAVGTLDRQLLVVLEGARLVPEELWRTLSAKGAA